MSKTEQTALGRRLKEARKSCRLTQDQVANHLNLPRTAVVNFESGERAVSTLELTKLARLFGRSVSELFAEAPSDEDVGAGFCCPTKSYAGQT